MTNTISDYSYDVQKLYLQMFLSDAFTFVRCQNIFDPNNFDQRLRQTAEFITTYVSQYKVMPDPSIVNANCKINFELLNLPQENYDWLMAEFERFSRHKALERAIINSADLLDKGDYGPVEKMIKDAVQISLNKDMGTDYFEDPRGRLLRLKENNGQISTGWPSVDKKLYGGFNRGQLNIWCAGSGGGKSLFLANMGINFALAGLNVIYFTFELDEGLVGMRVDSMLTGISSKEVFKQLDDVEMKVKMIGKKSGGIQIKYMPSGKNCNDLRSYLKEYKVKTGKNPDVLLVDYLDLMMPLSVKISPENMFIKDKFVSEELRNLAMESNTVVVTAAQLNRGAVEEIEFDHSHISGGLSKIQTADNVFGIYTSRAMKERGRYQVQFMKTRSSSGVGQKLDLEFNIDTLRITDLGDDGEPEPSLTQQKNNNPSPSGTSAVLQGIKKSSTVVEEPRPDDPTVGKPVGKIKGAHSTALIRDMISQLNAEKD